MDIVYRKTGFKREFLKFLVYNINNHMICFEKKTINTSMLKIPCTQHEFLALNTYLSSFSKKKTDAKIYIANSQHAHLQIEKV